MLAYAETQAQNLYTKPARTTMSDRSNEADLFRQSIADLRQVAATKHSLNGENAEKLSRNLQLWDMLSIDLMSPQNALPDEIKNSLIDLGKFVRQHTLGLYAGRGEVDVLIDINVAILDGLVARTPRKSF